MADNISKKILISVQYANDEAVQAVNNFKVANDQAAASTLAAANAINELKIAEQQAKTTTSQNRAEISNLALAHKQATEATRQAKIAVDAASGSYAEAQKRLSALGKEIKNAENGFKSATPAIQAQIKEYNKLNTQLKAFDAQLGNHQRNVGNYASVLNSIIPGFSRFSNILQQATQSFSAMGGSMKSAGAETAEGAEEASAGLESMGVVANIAAVAIIAVTATMYGLYTYLDQFAGYSDKFTASINTVKSGVELFANTLLGDAKWKDLIKNIKQTADESYNSSMKLAELGRQAKNAQTLTEGEDAAVALNLKKMRDRTTDAITAQKIYNETLAITAGQHSRNHKIAMDAYSAEIQQATAGYVLSEDEKNSVLDLSQGYEKVLENAKKLVDLKRVNKDFLNITNPGLQALIAIDSKQQQADQQIKNRDDAKQAKEIEYAQKQKELQDEITRGTEQANSDRIASITKMLEFEQEAFGRESSSTDEHYRQLIFKQQQFIEKQEAIQKNPKNSTKTRGMAGTAIGAAKDDIQQIQREKYAAQEKLLEDHSRKMLDETEKAANDLTKIQIAAIDNSEDKQRATNNLQFKEQQEALTQELQLLKENERKILVQMASASPEKLAELAKELAHEQELIDIANDKKTESQFAYQKTDLEITKKYADERLDAIDQMAIIEARIKDKNSPTDKNDKEVLAAEQKELEDKYYAEVANDKLTYEQKKLLLLKWLEDKANLEDSYAKKQFDQAKQTASIISTTTFSILKNSLQQSTEANQTYLELNKTKELQNSSLTSTQKEAINEKYRIKEGQAKVKDFKANQKLSIAEAIINGALAALKIDAQTGVLGFAFTPVIIAETAAAVATISLQQPPAYATGGLHYISDGTGARLRGPGSGTSDSMNARLSNGESIINAKSTQWFAPLLSAINMAGGGRPFDNSPANNSWFTPGFASGGIYTPTIDNGLRPMPVSSQMHIGDINTMVNGIVSGMSNAINSLPIPVVDVKDINYQQNRLASVQDRASYQ